MIPFAPMLSFVIYGTPQPQGSMRAFIPKHWKRPIITTDNKQLKPWRHNAAVTAQIAMKKAGLSIFKRHVPLKLLASFWFDKPKSEKKEAKYKGKEPDLDKLIRALGDALTGIVFNDDAQVCVVVAEKLYGYPARTLVTVHRL